MGTTSNSVTAMKQHVSSSAYQQFMWHLIFQNFEALGSKEFTQVSQWCH